MAVSWLIMVEGGRVHSRPTFPRPTRRHTRLELLLVEKARRLSSSPSDSVSTIPSPKVRRSIPQKNLSDVNFLRRVKLLTLKTSAFA